MNSRDGRSRRDEKFAIISPHNCAREGAQAGSEMGCPTTTAGSPKWRWACSRRIKFDGAHGNMDQRLDRARVPISSPGPALPPHTTQSPPSRFSDAPPPQTMRHRPPSSSLVAPSFCDALDAVARYPASTTQRRRYGTPRRAAHTAGRPSRLNPSRRGIQALATRSPVSTSASLRQTIVCMMVVCHTSRQARLVPHQPCPGCDTDHGNIYTYMLASSWGGYRLMANGATAEWGVWFQVPDQHAPFMPFATVTLLRHPGVAARSALFRPLYAFPHAFLC